jgi:hypothetical protein
VNGTNIQEQPHQEITVLECDGMLSLPPRIKEAAGLREGAIIYATITDAGILLRGGRPTDSPRRWLRARTRLKKLQEKAGREQEARRQAEGRQVYYTLEEFFEALEQGAAEDDADV